MEIFPTFYIANTNFFPLIFLVWELWIIYSILNFAFCYNKSSIWGAGILFCYGDITPCGPIFNIRGIHLNNAVILHAKVT